MEESTALVRLTEFEEMVKGYKKENEEAAKAEAIRLETDPDSPKNVERKNIIARQVQKAYLLLRDLGKPFTEMTVKEFELAQTHIRKMADKEKQQLEKELKATWFFRWRKLGKLKNSLSKCTFVLDRGYQRIAKDSEFSAYLPLIGSRTNDRGIDWTMQLPPNFEKLVEEIFRIRHRDV